MQGMKCGAAAAGGGGGGLVEKLFEKTLTAPQASVTMNLSGIDLSQYRELYLHIDNMKCENSGTNAYYLKINNDGTSGHYGAGGSSSATAQSYLKLGTTSYSNAVIYRVRAILFDVAGRLGMFKEYATISLSSSAGVYNMWNYTDNAGYTWEVGTLADANTITLMIDSTSFSAGTEIWLYGLKK